jgi:hypothetical protein
LPIPERDNPHDPNLAGYYKYFRRASIPLARRTYDPNTFVGFKWVSIQPIMDMESSFLYRDRYGNLKTQAIRARTRETVWIIQKPELDDAGNYNLKQEAEIIARSANKLNKMMMGEIVQDLYTNAESQFVHEWKSREHLEDMILMASATVNKRCGYVPNWIICSPEIAYSLLEMKQPDSDDSTAEIGKLTNKLTVYSCPGVRAHRIIIGYKGDPYTSGYFYCPYTPTFVSPGVDPGPGNHWDYAMLNRYGKVMPFPQFYGRIDLKNYSPIESTSE